MRRNYKRYDALAAEAEDCEAHARTCHAAALPGLLLRAIRLWLEAADYGHPEPRAVARARAGQAASQLALTLARPETTRLSA